MTNISDTEGLQKQLDCLYKYVSRYQLIVNTLKHKILVYCNTDEDQPEFTFNNNKIEICTSYKYFGVFFNSAKHVRGNLVKDMPKYVKTKAQIALHLVKALVKPILDYGSENYVKDKARKACFASFRKCSGIGKITPQIGLHLFNAFVNSILDYGSENWSYRKTHQEIKSVQLGKMPLNVKSSTCAKAIYAETVQYPIHMNQCFHGAV